MATEGKLPLLGFAAGAAKFLTLLGFSPRPATTQAAYMAASLFHVADTDDIYFTADTDPIYFTATEG